MSALNSALERLDPAGRGVTAAEVVDEIKSREPRDRDLQAELRSAVEDLCGRVDGRALGYKLRHFARRNFGGKVIDRSGEDRLRGNRWAVRPAGGTPHRREPSPASPAEPQPPAGDAGDAGDVPDGKPSERREPSRRRYGNDDRPHEWRA
jgi:hypothetical protein